jgi:hypothetical protein
MPNFHMPASWYDPPENPLQSRCEEVDARGYYAIYEVDADGFVTNSSWHLPDDWGERDELQKYWDTLDEEEREGLAFLPMTDDHCYLIAENEASRDEEYGGYE